MKQFNLLKEVHGIRARLMGVDYQPERKINKNNIYAVFLLAAIGFILYVMSPMLESGFKDLKNEQSTAVVLQKPEIQKTESETQDSTTPHTQPLGGITPPSGEVINTNPAPVENEDMIKSKSDIVKSIVVKKEKKEARHGAYIIRVATCVLKESADVVQKELKAKGFSSYQKTAAGFIKGRIANLHKVYVGDYNSRQDVLSVVDKLKANGFSAIVEERENG
jgi:cell division septation protein DedD